MVEMLDMTAARNATGGTLPHHHPPKPTILSRWHLQDSTTMPATVSQWVSESMAISRCALLSLRETTKTHDDGGRLEEGQTVQGAQGL